MQLFEQFNQVGVTVFIATHDLDLVQTMSYRQIAIRNGRLDSEQTL
jgi:cell division transport system ATP-binding protein